MLKNHPKALPQGCKEDNNKANCKYYNFSIKKIWDGKSLNQKYFKQFIKDEHYNEMMRNDSPRLRQEKFLRDTVKTIGPKQQNSATDVRSAFNTFDNMWLDLTSKKAAIRTQIH